MIEVKVVIGANYGDEGKGLATRYFCDKAKGNVLNVLFNGGCQRGHTVELKNGVRHIFHHLGSGTFSGADNYFDRDFMINPAVFVKEYQSLVGMGYVPKCKISPMCRVTTPYDVFINQIVEKSRGDNRHGSCGCGVWETRMRYFNTHAQRWNDYQKMSKGNIMTELRVISHEYLPARLREYGIYEIPAEYKDLVYSESLAERFSEDLMLMQDIVETRPFEVIANYDTVVYEGAQGLALSDDNTLCYPYVTASDTTSRLPVNETVYCNANVEVCYVTRSYFTRHGEGFFQTECNKNGINPEIEDKTNVPNEFQGTIRYGRFDYEEFYKRIAHDKSQAKSTNTNVKFSGFITHLNYTNQEIFGNCTVRDVARNFDNIYLSNTKYAEDVKIYTKHKF